MDESKIDLTERLRREGREKEASEYRNKVREQLRAEGKTRKEAMQAAWEAARRAFPPLPIPERTPAVPPVVAVTDQVAHDEVDLSGGEEWVITWFSPLHWLAEWQAKHGVNLTNEALTDLLQELVGFSTAWAWMHGARGNHPPTIHRSSRDSAARVAALIESTFEQIAEVVTVEDLATFRPTQGVEATSASEEI